MNWNEIIESALNHLDPETGEVTGRWFPQDGFAELIERDYGDLDLEAIAYAFADYAVNDPKGQRWRTLTRAWQNWLKREREQTSPKQRYAGTRTKGY